MAQDQSTFNEQAYLAANPDVAAAIGQPGVSSGYEHYINYGQNEGRQAQFDATPQSSGLSGGFGLSGIYDPNSAEFKQNYGEAYANPDIQNLDISGATEAKDLYNLKTSDPNQYYQQIADKLGDQIYVKYGANNNYDAEYNQLQAIKEKNPQAYYANQLKFLGEQAGWQIGQNTNDRNGPVYAQIQSLIPEAQKAGLTPEQINSIVGGSINQANHANQGRIASDAAMGGPGVFTGAIPVLGMAAIAALTGGAGLGAEELAGPTYGELGYTGLAEGAMGPTYAEMGYTGLNNAQAIAAADAAAASANGLSGADAIKYVNRARQIGNLLNNLGGSSGNSVARMSGQNSGINAQQLASALGGGSTAFPSSFIGQIKANEHPFLFDVPGQTKATEGTYDVSGSNLAKALRKA